MGTQIERLRAQLSREKFVRLREEKLTYDEIAEGYGVGRQVVERYGAEVLPARLRRVVVRGGWRYKVLDEGDVEEIVDLRRRGCRWADIGDHYGVRAATIVGMLSRRGYNVRGLWQGLGTWTGTVEECLEEVRASRPSTNETTNTRIHEYASGAGERARCTRCDLLDEPENPVEDGLCLWCRLDLAGVILWRYYQEDGNGRRGATTADSGCVAMQSRPRGAVRGGGDGAGAAVGGARGGGGRRVECGECGGPGAAERPAR